MLSRLRMHTLRLSYVIKGLVKPDHAGCWGTSGEVDCQSSNCTSTKKPSKVLNNTMFCCCLGDFCNVNVTDGYVPSDDDNTEIDLRKCCLMLVARQRSESHATCVATAVHFCTKTFF